MARALVHKYHFWYIFQYSVFTSCVVQICLAINEIEKKAKNDFATGFQPNTPDKTVEEHV